MHGHVYSHGIFFKKANHYNNFNCYTLGNAKPVVGTSKNLAEPDYDVIKMVAILNFNTKIVNEYDQEIPQSQTADNPVAP